MGRNGISEIENVLSAEGLVKSFGLTPALRDASLAVRIGEAVAIMGKSGSGKSTLLHCLAGIQIPDHGQVLFMGTRIDQLPDPQRAEMRRRDFGFVFQFGQLVGELTARENVALPLLLGKVRRRQALAQAGRWLSRMELTAREADRRPAELSGGQAQRVAVARALAFSPKVIFADEPTGSLDQETGRSVLTVLLESAHEAGAALVLVTHDPDVAALADRTVTVVNGMLAAATEVVSR